MLYGIFKSLSENPEKTAKKRIRLEINPTIDRCFIGEDTPKSFIVRISKSIENIAFKTINLRNPAGDNSSTDKPELIKPMNIWTAAKFGSIDLFQTFIKQEGAAAITSMDDFGNTPAHFAALANQIEILQMIHSLTNISEVKDQVNSTSLNMCNHLGQTPLHWSAMNGNIAAAEFLLNEGSANIDQQDSRGYTPLIVACQSCEIDMCGYLMIKGARLQLCDQDGCNALHWAAVKVSANLIRFLIYSGFNPHQRDLHGLAPLHFASLSGDLNSVRDLCVLDRVEVNVKDKNNVTPLRIAEAKQHNLIEEFLNEEIERRKSNLYDYLNFKRWFYGQLGNSRGPLLTFIFTIVFYAYPYYAYRIMPLVWMISPWINYIFIFLNVMMWIWLMMCATTNPGYLERHTSQYEDAIKEAASFTDWIQVDRSPNKVNPLHRLCHTCQIVKAARSKHCKYCNRCVMEFDHHCPYITNCVGQKNRRHFALFVLSANLLALFTGYIFYVTWNPLVVDVMHIFSLTLTAGAIVVSSLSDSCVWYHALYNVTTNEMMNWRRYPHFQTARGHFYHPFDRGYLWNLLEFLHLSKLSSAERRLAKKSNDLNSFTFPLLKSGAEQIQSSSTVFDA